LASPDPLHLIRFTRSASPDRQRASWASDWRDLAGLSATGTLAVRHRGPGRPACHRRARLVTDPQVGVLV